MKQRRHPYRMVLNVVVGIVLPLLLVRTALLALESSAICPPISCLGWRLAPLFFRGGGNGNLYKQELGKELREAYLINSMEGEGQKHMDLMAMEDGPDSLDDLMAEMASSSYYRLDIKTFVLKSKAMFVLLTGSLISKQLMKMERKLQSARIQASMYKYLASVGIPKSMHCLTLRLAEEYSINSLARSCMPPPEHAFCLTDSSHLHIILLTDNVIAASVAVSSTLASSVNTDKLVFHIITDRNTYSAMHAWFALHPAHPAIVEVKSLHQFDWPAQVSAVITDTIGEIHQSLLDHQKYSSIESNGHRRLEALKPSAFSLLNYMRIHLPELFPKLERVILLDDDVVVQRDLMPLWDLDLDGNVIGAVCVGRKLGDYLNFSDPLISSSTIGLQGDRCAWSGGMNVFDLKEWRRSNITQTYQHWIKLNRESGFQLWHLGWLPPALVAFDGHVQPIDPLWHLTGLGRRMPEPVYLESAAVLHFSGPGKPWLEIGFPQLREIWRSHVNRSDEFIRSCNVVD